MITASCEHDLLFYQEQSLLSDPHAYEALFRDLPSDIPSLVRVVQGLLFHPAWVTAFRLRLPRRRYDELTLRSIPEKLRHLLCMNNAPLTVARPIEQRLLANCRDFALLLVAMLRYHKIPARLRIGFAGYFPVDRLRAREHRLVEYWSAEQSRWVLLDPQIDAFQRSSYPISFNTLDLDADAPFRLVAAVWQRCRSGQDDPHEYGDSERDRGMGAIRYALLHDFDALNKYELVGLDAWHPLLTTPIHELMFSDLEMLDQIAELLANVNRQTRALRDYYFASPYGQATVQQLRSLLARPQFDSAYAAAVPSSILAERLP